MSFTMANDPVDLLALVGGAAAVAGGLWWSTRRDAAKPGRIVALCTDGSTIGVKNGAVRRRPGPRPRNSAESRVDLDRGDLAFVRVREGRTGEAPWIVEGLDREAEPFRISWEFETSDAALAAYRALDEFVTSADPEAIGAPPHITDREFDERWAATSATRDVARRVARL